VYPNPANDYIFIGVNIVPENATIEVYDMIGRKVSAEKMNDKLNRISLQNFTNGVYHVRIISNNTILFEQKIIKAE
ncbi:MAG: T9SS type A sorting domain-containing protein, partial [Bacteroidia bacterium]